MITVRDRGPGIADLPAVLAAFSQVHDGMGVGLLGAQRLMDAFEVTSKPRDERYGCGKHLPRQARSITPSRLRRRGRRWQRRPADAVEEIGKRSRAVLLQMDDFSSHQQEDLEQLDPGDATPTVVSLPCMRIRRRADHLRRADELEVEVPLAHDHQFRTPLNSILALSNLLLARADGELTAEQETPVRFIRKAAENLTELVDDLLDLAKVEAGKTVVTPSPFAAVSLFGAARHAAAAAGRRRRRAGVR